jgi:hypothetical protein
VSSKPGAGHNENRRYGDQVRPSNFMLAFQINPVAISEFAELLNTGTGKNSSQPKLIKVLKPVAPFDRDPAKAVGRCFDRDTDMAVPKGALKSYKDALAQYHLRPEHKFHNGNYRGRGITSRRCVRPINIRQIGKESNRWGEKFYLGSAESAEIEYGSAPTDSKRAHDILRKKISAIGQREVARRSGVSRRTLDRFMRGAKSGRKF